MLSITFFLIVVVLFVVSILLSKNKILARMFLIGLYVTIFSISINTIQAGIIADERGLDGGKVGWFGPWWPEVLLSLLLISVISNVILYKRKHKV